MTIPEMISSVNAITAIGLILILSARLKRYLKQSIL